MNPKLDTVCKECIFAQYIYSLEDNEKRTQIDCDFGRLDKYKEQGIEILECYDIDEDGSENEFFVVENYKCAYKRSKSWSEQNPNHTQRTVLDEIELKYQVVIYDDGDISDLKTTIESLKQQVLQPKHISIIRDKKGSSLQHIHKAIEMFPWKIHDIDHEKSKLHMAYNKEGERLRYIDLALKSKHYPYYVVCHAGYEFGHKDIFNELNRKILDEHFVFSMLFLTPETYIVPYSIHSIFNGNHISPLKGKLEFQWEGNDGIDTTTTL